MAAAINAAIISGFVLFLGLLIAIMAFIKHKNRPILRWVGLVLYLCPVIALGVVYLCG
jgi:ABC-type sugar transport system permease subunit